MRVRNRSLLSKNPPKDSKPRLTKQSSNELMSYVLAKGYGSFEQYLYLKVADFSQSE